MYRSERLAAEMVARPESGGRETACIDFNAASELADKNKGPAMRGLWLSHLRATGLPVKPHFMEGGHQAMRGIVVAVRGQAQAERRVCYCSTRQCGVEILELHSAFD